MSRYIEIDVFRKATQNFGFVSTGNYDYDCGYNECMSVIESILSDYSTADVAEVKHGKWIKMYNNPGDGNYYCSECHKYRDIVTRRKTPRDRDFSYCPNCGARMEWGGRK